MSRYKPGYSEAHSPYYELGFWRGMEDAARKNRRPPEAPAGPDPDLAWSVMYQRGYQDGIS